VPAGRRAVVDSRLAIDYPHGSDGDLPSRTSSSLPSQLQGCEARMIRVAA
jgi:hypothetical protein